MNGSLILGTCLFLIAGDIISTPRIFAAPDSHLKWIKSFCNTENPMSHVGIDMTYKIGPYYVTTLTMPIPIFVWKKRPYIHPGIVVALSISVCKQEEDYLYLSQQLKSHGKLETLIYGTDGEVAIETAFEKTYPIEGLYCFNVGSDLSRHASHSDGYFLL